MESTPIFQAGEYTNCHLIFSPTIVYIKRHLFYFFLIFHEKKYYWTIGNASICSHCLIKQRSSGDWYWLFSNSVYHSTILKWVSQSCYNTGFASAKENHDRYCNTTLGCPDYWWNFVSFPRSIFPVITDAYYAGWRSEYVENCNCRRAIHAFA